MYPVSKSYKESMKSPIRNHSYMVVSIGMINQDAQRSAIVDEQSLYKDFSDFNIIFNTGKISTQYATFESNFFKADGSRIFLPRDPEQYIKNSLITDGLFSSGMSIKFIFGCGKTDIKGLTIRFGDNYPTAFVVATESGATTSYVNDSSFFETDKVFADTESITITITSMSNTNSRVRINYIKFGIGLEYDNEHIMSAESDSVISMIDDDLPQIDFSVSLENTEQIFNVDNPESIINFLESGQRLNVMLGYELDDGSIEWIQMHSLYISEWGANDEKATIKAVDRFQLMNEKYYRGQYYEDGISLYELAESVFEDIGLAPDEYYMDPCLKSIIVNNPLPNIPHKEALQIIANAGMCVLGYGRSGEINIRSYLPPDFTTSSNGVADCSDASSIDADTKKDTYATYEKNYWKADGAMLFLNKSGASNCGYISSQISNDDGAFSENPIITRTFENPYKCYDIYIKFNKTVSCSIAIRTYNDESLVDSMYVEISNLDRATISHEFNEFNKIEIEFTNTELPGRRINIDYISIGSETDYRIEYDDLFSTPIGMQVEKVKNLKVARTMFAKVETRELLITDNVTYHDDGDNLLYYFDSPCYGYVVHSTVGSAKIVSSGAYFVELSLSSGIDGWNADITIEGYKYNKSTAYYTKSVENNGVDKEWNNPIISSEDHARKVAEWISDYYSSRVEYDLDFRGDPALDVGDTIYQENKYNDELKTVIEESKLKFEKSIKGSLITRRK